MRFAAGGEDNYKQGGSLWQRVIPEKGLGCELSTGNSSDSWKMISASILKRHLGSAHSIHYSLSSRMLCLNFMSHKYVSVTLKFYTEMFVLKYVANFFFNLQVESVRENTIFTCF